MTGAEPLIRVRDLVKLRRGSDRSFELVVPAVDIVAGRPVAFVGPSGCGKSTLIDLLAMTLEPDGAAEFRVADGSGGPPVDVADLWRRRRLDALARLRARRFGYVLQTGGLLPFLSVAENIALPQRVLGAIDRALVAELAARLDIADQLGDRPGRLSIGQRQRVAIARALAHRPPIVLADEPTASLDPLNAEAVMRLFMDLVEDFGAALVLVTHDAELAAAFGIPLVHAAVDRDGTATRTVFGAPAGASPEDATGVDPQSGTGPAADRDDTTGDDAVAAAPPVPAEEAALP